MMSWISTLRTPAEDLGTLAENEPPTLSATAAAARIRAARTAKHTIRAGMTRAVGRQALLTGARVPFLPLVVIKIFRSQIAHARWQSPRSRRVVSTVRAQGHSHHVLSTKGVRLIVICAMFTTLLTRTNARTHSITIVADSTTISKDDS